MKLNIASTKFIIQLLILLILAVLIFILSTFLYSIRYWPDVYNYINANITIKRIHTITELNLTYFDDTTEFYTTTDFVEDTTIEYEPDYFSLDDVESRKRRYVDIEKDYIELPNKVLIDYFFEIENSTNVMNEDEGKWTTVRSEDVEVLAGGFNKKHRHGMHSDSCPGGTSDDVTTVYTWIAAIFIKNGTDQFQYYCDGAILSPNVIITAARCVNFTTAEDILVILGKTSLQQIFDSEKMIKIKEVIIHENFTNTNDDLAILKTEDAIETSETISIACLYDSDEYTEALTTGWAISGNLTAIDFYKDKSEECSSSSSICGVYRNDITHCPSFGGIFAAKHKGWYLKGIRSTEDENRTMCIHAPVYYTPLYNYVDWIRSVS
ncbi:chymotrypsin-C-like isoform X2 [Colias croceus]|uniref:chymotrypsin-C-like isoform X2 n=1 Tax=Colias crocea TaxID=72248 RepID=UPI001E280D8E|nr:chymotrypsin-C-like isoform X2 [Colias croceus]